MSIRNYHQFMGYENPNNQPAMQTPKPKPKGDDSTPAPQESTIPKQQENATCSLELF